MSYCHECGEEIADIDTFCPYCGISLKPIIDSSEESDSGETEEVIGSPEEMAGTDPVQDETIAISGDQMADVVARDADQPITTQSNEEQTESEEAPVAADAADNGVDIPADEQDLKVSPELQSDSPMRPVEQEEVPEEKLLFTARPTGDDLDKSPVAGEVRPEDSVSEPAGSDEDREPVYPPSAEMSPPADADLSETEDREISVPDDISAEVTDSTNIPSQISPETEETPPVSSAVSEEKKGEADFIETIPYIQSAPEPVEKPVLSDADQPQAFTEADAPEQQTTKTTDSITEMPDTPDLLKEETDTSQPDRELPDFSAAEELPEEPSEELKTVEEPVPPSTYSSDEPIGQPAEELVEPTYESRFDSVKIREDDERSGEPDILELDRPIDHLAQPHPAEPEAGESQLPTDETVEETATPESAEAAVPNDRKSSSYTTPNIKGPETGGRKSKLKPLEEGRLLNGRYEIIRKIGGGGMGAVYLASDKNLGGVLRAVKEMVQSYIEPEQQDKAINDFKRESLLLTSLEHQSIPTIYDYFYDKQEGRFYLVMKYINGGDLASRLRSSENGRIDELTVTEWAVQIADVLNYLHNRQPPIVYRDLKPANIMIDGNTGRVMLIDFGIARWINKEEKGVTAVGTMGYAPPELFSGNVGPNSDIYSLGSTMFHLLTGEDPQNNPLLIFDFQKNPKPRQINPQISDQMERILMRMVEYNAEKRFSTASELHQALSQHLVNLKGGNATYGVKGTPAAVSLKDEKVFCGFCGKKIVASDLFCAFCGAKQPIAQKGVHAEEYASTPLTAKLVIMGTNELDPPSYKIEKDDNLVGRRDPMSNIFPEVDLSKYDPQTKISRRHARIWREGNNYMIEDLGSSNGTVLIPVVSDTTRLLPKQPHILTNGDKLKLGDTTLHFIIG